MTTSTACTNRKLVAPPPSTAGVNERGSAQMFFRKVGQMTQLHTPKASRNTDQPRLSLMLPSNPLTPTPLLAASVTS